MFLSYQDVEYACSGAWLVRLLKCGLQRAGLVNSVNTHIEDPAIQLLGGTQAERTRPITFNTLPTSIVADVGRVEQMLMCQASLPGARVVVNARAH